MSQSKRVIGLDVVRSGAVLLVLFCHLPFTVPLAPRPDFLYRYARIAAAVYGVELFFVLSGFLIGGILLRQYQREGFSAASLLPFWIRRWFRTIPNYYLFLLTMGVYALYHGHAVHWLRHALFLQNLASYHVDDLYGVSWSLCVEEFMYLLLPLILLLWHKCTSGRQEATVLLTIATLTFVPLALRLSMSAGLPFDSGIRKIVMYRLDAITVGVLLAYFSTYHPAWFTRLSSGWAASAGLGIAGAAVLGLYPLLSDITHVYSRWVNALLLPTIDVGLMLVVAYSATVPSIGAFFNRFFEIISTRSYSLYLFHLLLILLVMGWIEPLHLSPALQTGSIIFLAVAGAFGLSEMVYRFYELPMTALREQWRKPQVKPLYK